MSNDNHNAPETVELTAEEVSEQRKIRREKLQELRDMGRDPFVQETYNVTAHSKDIKENFEAIHAHSRKIRWLLFCHKKLLNTLTSAI